MVGWGMNCLQSVALSSAMDMPGRRDVRNAIGIYG